MAKLLAKKKLSQLKEKTISIKNELKSEIKDKIDSGFGDRFQMPGLIRQARISLEHWEKHVASQKETKFPYCCGIALATTVQAAMGYGYEGTMGIVIARLDDGYETNEQGNPIQRWSQPCAIGSFGLSAGIQLGTSKADHIMLLTHPRQLDTFTSGTCVCVSIQHNTKTKTTKL